MKTLKQMEAEARKKRKAMEAQERKGNKKRAAMFGFFAGKKLK